MSWLKVEQCSRCTREIHGERTEIKLRDKVVRGWSFKCDCGMEYFRPKSSTVKFQKPFPPRIHQQADHV